MPVNVRPSQANDAPQWLDLVKSVLGEEYPDKQVYSTPWIARHVSSSKSQETWVAENDGKILASLSFLSPTGDSQNPVTNLGRHLSRAEAMSDGSAEALVRKAIEIASQRGTILVTRVLASDNPQQALLEKHGFVCAGFQPFKHMARMREGALFYIRIGQRGLGARLPISQSLSQIQELSSVVLEGLKIPNPPAVRDGAVGYPLQTELRFHEATIDDYELWRVQAQAANPPVEISGAFNLGYGYLRTTSDDPLRAFLAQRDEKMVAGVAYYLDPFDRCVRLVSAFSSDDLSMGALLHHALKKGEEQHSALYTEVDMLMTAPRLLKSAEQLGFVPIAYLPGFYTGEGGQSDVVKMVKLNMVYSLESTTFTTQAKKIVEIIDHNFQDQKVGLAIINLLRALPIFEGLGDGELRKMARLFTQKLYRPGEKIFNKGDLGNEAFVVMRGQVDIQLDEESKPIATMGNGQIFGELAFLDGAARVALAVASQPSILLVIQRSAFSNLVQHEPHLGMVVMRNIAIELSNRLRKTNAVVASGRK